MVTKSKENTSEDLENENIQLVINRINETYRNKLIVIGVVGLFFLLILFSIIWLFIPIILILIYAAYRSDITKISQLNIDRKTLASVGSEFKKLEQSDLFEVCGYYNTGQWFIKNGSLGFGFFNVKDIVWVHLQNTKHSVNFVPTGTSHGIHVYLKSGGIFMKDYGRDTQAIVMAKMTQLQKIAPWAIYGWSQQLKTLWNEDRANFVNLAEQNWQKILQQYWQQQRSQQSNNQGTINQPVMPVSKYYTILGLKPNATQSQIKEVYRKLVKKYHPDINKSSQASSKMREINEAYSILSNPEKRINPTQSQYTRPQSNYTYTYNTTQSTAEKLTKERVTRENGYLYYLGQDGYVWKTPMKENPNGKKEKVGTERVNREKGYLYFIDKNGYVARTKMNG